MVEQFHVLKTFVTLFFVQLIVFFPSIFVCKMDENRVSDLLKVIYLIAKYNNPGKQVIFS